MFSHCHSLMKMQSHCGHLPAEHYIFKQKGCDYFSSLQLIVLITLIPTFSCKLFMLHSILPSRYMNGKHYNGGMNTSCRQMHYASSPHHWQGGCRLIASMDDMRLCIMSSFVDSTICGDGPNALHMRVDICTGCPLKVLSHHIEDMPACFCFQAAFLLFVCFVQKAPSLLPPICVHTPALTECCFVRSYGVMLVHRCIGYDERRSDAGWTDASWLVLALARPISLSRIPINFRYAPQKDVGPTHIDFLRLVAFAFVLKFNCVHSRATTTTSFCYSPSFAHANSFDPSLRSESCNATLAIFCIQPSANPRLSG